MCAPPRTLIAAIQEEKRKGRKVVDCMIYLELNLPSARGKENKRGKIGANLVLSTKKEGKRRSFT